MNILRNKQACPELFKDKLFKKRPFDFIYITICLLEGFLMLSKLLTVNMQLRSIPVGSCYVNSLTVGG